MADRKPESQADKRETQEGAVRSGVMSENLGEPYPQAMQERAESLPEKDEVQQAYKAAFLADSTQAEVREKVKVVDASPNSEETPSGHALRKVAGIAHDQERGERYAREKTARRWGYVPVDE